MLILTIDSVGAACGVGVWHDGAMLARLHEKMERGQDARLMPMIVASLNQTGKSFADLDRVAVTRGPGSFTGVRVGLSAARGIGLAAQKPVIGIDRFSIYRALHPQGDLLAVVDSRRAELFCQYFPAQDNPHESRMMTQTEIDAFITAHPGAKIAGDIATPDDDVVNVCAKLAAEANAGDENYAPRPLYLRPPDVTLPKSR